MAAAKIFVFGSVDGQLQSAFSKLASIHAKTGFSFALVTGNLFAEPDLQDQDALSALLDGQIYIVCPTYFTVGTHALPPRVLEKIEADEEIAPNLHYLGKRSTTKTSEGVRIVTLGGILDPNIVAGQSKDQTSPFHTESDAKSLRGANNADILLTTMWPADVWKNSSKAKELSVDSNSAPSSSSIAELCAALKPRYHFSTSATYFEREPFFPEAKEEAEDKGIALTRFISMAPWANPAKQKAMYAFTVNRQAVITPPPGSTLTPFFKAAPAPKRSADQAGFSRFSHHDGDHRHRKHRRERSPPPGPDRCFFCLSNPNLPTHMIPSVADDSYLATAKGPLPSADTFKKHGLDFPGHMIIIPLEHKPSLSSAFIPGEDLPKIFKEMTRFRESLQAMVSSKSERKLGAVTWEINRARNIHTHWQLMPVPAEMVTKGLVESGFRVLAKDFQLGDFVVKEFGTADEVEGDYLRVWTWAEDEDRIVSKPLLLRFDESVRFDLQFPRKVMAKLLDLEDRVVWQNIGQTEAEETADMEAFRAGFKEWDFTLAS
ncbi:CwfJ C-terminus 1-domain-containing protein-like protein [Podospora aff. communis PSN243]|uniref:CwfJ C-terminus 1-domain-containing protein-like protein n=1 Tax=Podospora aff. communis PSN243 TaxID=3040156 RepID=A0AAV9G7X4_9PEZI|nr:CwfJ C-terminus 1-domain-containing protein-like protein [Podospora aff. communis PSN243]